MAAGAIAGYALQVGENRAQGMDWGAALTKNISGEKILAGALIGGGVVLGAALASVGITAIGAAVGGACIDGDCGNEIQLSAKLGQDVWKMNPFTRGMKIESTLGRSPQLVQNFPTIDRFENGVVTSIKSIDLAAKSYQNLQTLQSTLKGYVTKLANFDGASFGGFSISQNMINDRQLLLAISPNASADQLKVIQKITSWAANQGVKVVQQIVR